MSGRLNQLNGKVKEKGEPWTLSTLFGMSEQRYEEFFNHFRTDISYRIFRRNVVIALGNSNEPGSLSLLQTAAKDKYPEVRSVARAYLDSMT
jgi:epoxyqueuosine reductase QueG